MNDDRETVTGKYNTIYYEDLPTVTEIADTETTLPTRTSYTPSIDSHGKTFKYKPYPSPGSVKSMPQKQSNLEIADNSKDEKNEKAMTTISAVTNTPSSQFTEAMKKFTYSLRTTASPLPALPPSLPQPSLPPALAQVGLASLSVTSYSGCLRRVTNICKS